MHFDNLKEARFWHEILIGYLMYLVICRRNKKRKEQATKKATSIIETINDVEERIRQLEIQEDE